MRPLTGPCQGHCGLCDHRRPEGPSPVTVGTRPRQFRTNFRSRSAPRCRRPGVDQPALLLAAVGPLHPPYPSWSESSATAPVAGAPTQWAADPAGPVWGERVRRVPEAGAIRVDGRDRTGCEPRSCEGVEVAGPASKSLQSTVYPRSCARARVCVMESDPSGPSLSKVACMCEYVVVGHTHANRDTRSRDRVGRIALYTRTHARANTHTHTLCVSQPTHTVCGLLVKSPRGLSS